MRKKTTLRKSADDQKLNSRVTIETLRQVQKKQGRETEARDLRN